MLHSTDADLVLITGDFISRNRYIDPVVQFLKNVRSRNGVYAVLGNHDYVFFNNYQHLRHFITGRYVANDWKKLVNSLGKVGVKVLINQHLMVKTGNAKIFIEGTDDPVVGRPRIAARNDVFDSADLRILMSHSPDILYSRELKKRFDLLLSGHTHGGQVRLPGIGALVTGTKYATRKESMGLYMKHGMHVNVSSGIGKSALPIRINCPPEVTILELTGAVSHLQSPPVIRLHDRHV